MADVTVYRIALDGLSRERWSFRLAASRGEHAIVLDSYSVERRKLPKGRFAKAVPSDRWESMDERYYYSGLKRPTSIPPEVVAEAWASVPRSPYIAMQAEDQKI